MRVTAILCQYPFVAIEKNRQNSVAIPQVILSFVELRLYTTIRINCKITSLTYIQWFAYEMIENIVSSFDDSREEADLEDYDILPESAEKFSSRFYNYQEVHGLTFTSKSEDITIKPRFLKIGRYIVCVNVAMLNVEGLDSTDCIFIIIALPPLVAGIANGVARSVQHGEVLKMNALKASYDPDVNTLADVSSPFYNISSSKLVFQFSCPFVVSGDSADQTDWEVKELMFVNQSGMQNISRILCTY